MRKAKAHTYKLILVFVAAWFSGCAENMASFEHFPKIRQSDLLAIDSVQSANNATSRWFYNCNFENDYKITFARTDFDSLKSRITKIIENEKFKHVAFNDTDSTITGTRGITLWEFKTLIKVYIRQTATLSFAYVKTEISQDITCGPNIDRAAPVVNNICKSLQCTSIKEIHPDTKQKLNLSIKSRRI